MSKRKKQFFEVLFLFSNIGIRGLRNSAILSLAPRSGSEQSTYTSTLKPVYVAISNELYKSGCLEQKFHALYTSMILYIKPIGFRYKSKVLVWRQYCTWTEGHCSYLTQGLIPITRCYNRQTANGQLQAVRCLLTGFKVTRSVIGAEGGDLQYLDIYKLLLSLTHRCPETTTPFLMMGLDIMSIINTLLWSMETC